MRRALTFCAVLLLGASASAHAPTEALAPRLNDYLLQYYGDDPKARFAIAWHDLDGDGHEEAIVRVLASGWCGSGGCLMLVLTPEGPGYREVGHAAIVNAPIRLLPTGNKGWRDIGVFVQGGGIIDGYTAALRFDGRQYPRNPSVPPAVRMQGPGGTILISDTNEGVPLSRQ